MVSGWLTRVIVRPVPGIPQKLTRNTGQVTQVELNPKMAHLGGGKLRCAVNPRTFSLQRKESSANRDEKLSLASCFYQIIHNIKYKLHWAVKCFATLNVTLPNKERADFFFFF